MTTKQRFMTSLPGRKRAYGALQPLSKALRAKATGGEGVSQTPLEDQAFFAIPAKTHHLSYRQHGIPPSTKTCFAQWPVQRAFALADRPEGASAEPLA